ncbi:MULTISPECIES: hemerythrin domain-containing protein [unclassified Brevundimonas]|uniref:hemerythrin domain-containing protein n=1 Tax=unclassified Brevundimonas TaxID=2622653 RepID=UPI0025C664FC|nr:MULTISPECIES: hemerythrin domain-containing protein [unclassified Brevundimonas]
MATQTPAAAKTKADQPTKKDPKKAKASAIAEAKSFAPELAVRIGSTPKTKFRGNPDVFGRLVEDHDKHRALIAMIEETTSSNPEQRKMLFEEFVKEVQSHANAEDQALWSTVLRDPSTTDDARHAVAEHKELDKLMADLAARDYANPGWLRRFAALKEEYLHHVGEEEQEQFVAAEKILSDSDLKYMRKVFERRKKAEKAAAKIEKKIKLKS